MEAVGLESLGFCPFGFGNLEKGEVMLKSKTLFR